MNSCRVEQRGEHSWPEQLMNGMGQVGAAYLNRVGEKWASPACLDSYSENQNSMWGGQEQLQYSLPDQLQDGAQRDIALV
jgi:hypothetical protein